jgi:hypothetical protein
MAMKKVEILVDVGSTDCMPNIDVAKLAGMNTMDMYVKILMFSPCVTEVRASRTAEALKSWIYTGKVEYMLVWYFTYAVSQGNDFYLSLLIVLNVLL